MTRDDIIRMAREAGFRAGHIELYSSDPVPFVAPCSATDCLPELERFAAIVAATERTACARHFDVAMRNAVTAEREARAQPHPAAAAEDDDLYWRLHSISKSLESCGFFDERDNPDAYKTVLDAMNFVKQHSGQRGDK